jgi:hypothetical protein
MAIARVDVSWLTKKGGAIGGTANALLARIEIRKTVDQAVK